MILVRLLLVVVIAIGTYLTLDVAYASAQVTKIAASPIPSENVAGATTSAEAIELPIFDPELGRKIDDALAGTTGTYAVVVKDLNTGATYTKNADRVYDTASLYKLWVMAETYHQIAEGKFTEDTKVSGTVEALNKSFGIASESAELKEGGFTMTVKEALEKMITVSHNYAAYMLTQKIKTANMKTFLTDNGLTHSQVGPDPKTTASDMELFFDKLSKKELGTPENTQKMLELLAGQKMNDRIPKYLPKDIRVMHKTGELDRVKHDVGIVSTPNGDYILVLMSDSSDQLAAAERLANISKGVYEYMSER
jgi:beta-lactamase class A